MSEELIDVQAGEVIAPEVLETEGVQVEEVTEPQRSEESERNAWYANKRRELEEAKKNTAAEFEAKLEAERARIAELESKNAKYEEQQKEAELRRLAEQTGVPYDELVEEVKKQEAFEETQRQLEEERKSKSELSEKLSKYEQDMALKTLEREDEDYFRSFETKPKLDDFFYKLRVSGLSSEEAYYAFLAKGKTVEVAEAPGKVNSVKAEQEFMTEEEWDSLPKERKDHLLANELDKVWKWQLKWPHK